MEEAVVLSCYRLTDEELADLVKKIPQLKSYQIKNIVDKKILGGLVIKFSDKMIDLSLKNKLAVIKEKLYEQL
jgi:F0F1-type ATP synthase delta subunit